MMLVKSAKDYQRSHGFYKGCSSKRETITVSAVALQDHIIHSHQLQVLSLADPFKSRTRNTKSIYKPMDKEMDRAVVDAGLRKKSTHHKNKEDAEKGYVLDPSPLQLTIAGTLIHAIYALQELNGQEGKNSWLGKLPCRSATNFSNSCACLKAFETFTGKKSCPTCRKEQYQTRVMHDGACLFKIKYTIKIQASWRRYIVRKWYKNLRKTVPPKDSKSRKQFFEEKVQQISN